MKKFFAVFGALGLAGCGLFDGDDPFDITFTEEVPFSFTIDADQFCPTTLDCDAAEGPAPDRIVLPEVEVDIDLDVLAATGSTQLREVSSRLKSVEVDRIEYAFKDNSLNFKSPEIRFFVAPLNASTRTAGAEVGSIPQAEPKTNASGTATTTEEQKKAASDTLKTLQISMIPFMKPSPIERNQPSPPKGSTTIEATIHLKFVANPTELL